MSAQSNAPIVIKKVKKVTGGGHHGGAWKVAYADFVTAMMAFFMLMWLLNATTEKQRKGIADYFSPTIPVMRASGGGNGAFGGDSVFTDETLAHTGHGGVPGQAEGDGASDPAAIAAEQASLEEIEEVLSGRSGESMVSDLARRHIVTELTDEGLVIGLHDLEGAPLFTGESSAPEPVMEDLLAMMAQVFGLVTNGIAIEGHVAAQPVVRAENTAWALSAGRAGRVREILEAQEVPPERLRRVTGHADRRPALSNPMAARNNRIELILLRAHR
ncbi:flagellar motor protein MotB [Sinisalibacter aestuarii]|uniref:Chemotaxis MotB protein n=1 Tax=Sinisalibacter aestuarii TaxID=2949426 RepID=A0ABQ5LQX7_9RHOB|nr:flagellar motor protein MotB [Sinisalibacter aestuarii]GKY86666.1 chemotaxis MotB protein [Sinisalibacter aestuarii]